MKLLIIFIVSLSTISIVAQDFACEIELGKQLYTVTTLRQSEASVETKFKPIDSYSEVINLEDQSLITAEFTNFIVDISTDDFDEDDNPAVSLKIEALPESIARRSYWKTSYE